MKEINIVRGLIKKGDKFLLLRKVKDEFPENIGKWEVPGGKIKFGETPNLAMRREVVEETKIPCRIVKELGVLEDTRNDIHSKAHIFLLDPTHTNVKLSSEHDHFMWVSSLEVKKLPMVLFGDLLIEFFESN
ncbi:NUDIX domain-containing protein [Candidatus Woesearchaeota archaeon]|nr:NUDIX domain-containing protein [Candidatus Woesearchaeota archaeon]MCF8013990.1 NUDIX domain-containing protein [Candidatus Woesearchaeota archaeon]